MKNYEKYKNAKERKKAFCAYCRGQRCLECPLNNYNACQSECALAWLDLEADEAKMTADEVADILEEYNKWRRDDGEYADAGVKRDITPKELGIAIDRAVEILRDVKE